MEKSNTMQLVVGVIIALLLGIWLGKTYFAPTEPEHAMPAAEGNAVLEKVDIINIPEYFKREFQNKKIGVEFDFLAQTDTGSIEVFKVKDKTAFHKHGAENHILYITRGKATGKIGDVTAEVKAGDLVLIPADIPHMIENTGSEPFEFILFSTPPFHAEDIQVVE